MRLVRVMALLSLAVAAASPAGADVLFTPFIGSNLTGTVSTDFGAFTSDTARTNFGASLARMGGGVFGVEADVGYSPRFFGTNVQVAGLPVSVVKNNVFTGMINLTAGIPIQGHGGTGIRPYAVGGIGLIHQQLEFAAGLVDYSSNDLGYDIGGGVMVFFGQHVGIRGDLRYFRATGGNPITGLVNLDPGDFNFTRASVGVTLR